jgi:hypothetical protein
MARGLRSEDTSMTSHSILRFVPYVPAVLLTLTGLVANAMPSKPDLGVKRLVLTHGVSAREPSDSATTFKTNDDRVYVFVEIDNPKKAEGRILVSFEPPVGSPQAEIPLKVGDTARFRTWAFTRQAHAAGNWAVVVRDPQGRELARERFTVEK